MERSDVLDPGDGFDHGRRDPGGASMP
jgi:hypothetical protein